MNETVLWLVTCILRNYCTSTTAGVHGSSLCCACLKSSLFPCFKMGSEFGRGPSGNQIWLWAAGPGLHRARCVTEDSKAWPPGSVHVLGGSDKQLLQPCREMETHTYTHTWKEVTFAGNLKVLFLFFLSFFQSQTFWERGCGWLKVELLSSANTSWGVCCWGTNQRVPSFHGILLHQ